MNNDSQYWDDDDQILMTRNYRQTKSIIKTDNAKF